MQIKGRPLISGKNGKIYLDTKQQRICIRGPEDRTKPNLGYQWLADDEVFPFYELRSAAQDLRGGIPFNDKETRRRIAAQLDTLIASTIEGLSRFYTITSVAAPRMLVLIVQQINKPVCLLYCLDERTNAGRYLPISLPFVGSKSSQIISLRSGIY